MIQEVRDMNPKAFRTGMGRRIGFTTPLVHDFDPDDIVERDIRLSARKEGKIILGRM